MSTRYARLNGSFNVKPPQIRASDANHNESQKKPAPGGVHTAADENARTTTHNNFNNSD